MFFLRMTSLFWKRKQVISAGIMKEIHSSVYVMVQCNVTFFLNNIAQHLIEGRACKSERYKEKRERIVGDSRGTRI